MLDLLEMLCIPMCKLKPALRLIDALYECSGSKGVFWQVGLDIASWKITPFVYQAQLGDNKTGAKMSQLWVCEIISQTSSTILNIAFRSTVTQPLPIRSLSFSPLFDSCKLLIFHGKRCLRSKLACTKAYKTPPLDW